ncbi:MAG: OmpA family protein [Myxococcota bacterium]|nr:OmpA family protein [Myxococcota bacterium]
MIKSPFPLLLSFFATLLLIAGGCAHHKKPLDPIPVQPVEAKEGQRLAVEDLVVVVDTSGSLDEKGGYPQAKQVIEGFVAALPDDEYDVGLIIFGGPETQSASMAPFDRDSLAMTAEWIPYGGGLTPIEDAIGQATEQVGEGPAAIVLFSDGVATRATKKVGPAGTVAVAEAAVAERATPLCFYTVRIGDEEGGQVLLEQLAEVGGCGRSMAGASWTDGSVLENDVQAMMFETVAVPLTGPLDTDQDGILDSSDQCPGTPKGADADERGCWTLSGSSFATGSAKLKPTALAELKAAAEVLEANPAIKIRVEGHTDSTGSAAINDRLSGQRADAVREQLIQDGVSADRIQAQGFGSSRPVGSNATAAGRAANRRVDIAILR